MINNQSTYNKMAKRPTLHSINKRLYLSFILCFQDVRESGSSGKTKRECR